MLGNRSLQVQLVKQPGARKDDVITEAAAEVDWDKIGKIAQETTQTVGKVAIVVYGAKKLIDTASIIATIAAKKYI